MSSSRRGAEHGLSTDRGVGWHRLVLLWKRLEQWPPISDGVMRLTASQLAALVDGMDWSQLQAAEIVRPRATS